MTTAADRPHPFRRNGLAGRVWAFALALAISLGTLPVASVEHPELALSACAVIAATTLVVGLAPWDRMPHRAAVAPPAAVVVVAFLLREATGGLTNPVDYEVLLMLAVVWVALYGDRLDLTLVIAISAGGFAASVATSEAGGDGWIKAALWPTAAAIVGLNMQALVQQVRAQSHSDRLTGLPNRARWDEELPREVARSRRAAEPLSVAILDIDHFKRVNDRHGHAAGDRLLRDAAAAWRAQVRASDLLARYGGEEFALLMPGTESEEAREVVDRVRACAPAGITCSAGLAQMRAEESGSDVVARADAALYAAKRGGRDRTCVA